MKIEITREIIAEAEKNYQSYKGVKVFDTAWCEICVIALAALAAGHEKVSVNNGGLVIGNEVYPHTTESLDYMHDFDKFGTAEPVVLEFNEGA